METVNFAFMKFFDLFAKIAIFRVLLVFLGDLRHALRPKSLEAGESSRHKSPRKRRNALKIGF